MTACEVPMRARIAQAPAIGPGTSARNTQRHVTAPAKVGMRRMLNIVSRYPQEVSIASAVPT